MQTAFNETIITYFCSLQYKCIYNKLMLFEKEIIFINLVVWWRGGGATKSFAQGDSKDNK